MIVMECTLYLPSLTSLTSLSLCSLPCLSFN